MLKLLVEYGPSIWILVLGLIVFFVVTVHKEIKAGQETAREAHKTSTALEKAILASITNLKDSLNDKIIASERVTHDKIETVARTTERIRESIHAVNGHLQTLAMKGEMRDKELDNLKIDSKNQNERLHKVENFIENVVELNPRRNAKGDGH